MGVEDIGYIDQNESGSQSAEISEKYKESVKKASRGIKKTQKDEKKGRKHDTQLARVLVQIILKREYEPILGTLLKCIDAGYSSQLILGILSLVYLPISNDVRKKLGKEKIEFLYETSPETLSFDDHHLPGAIRQRVNEWIEDIEGVLSLESSILITGRTLAIMLYDENIREFTKDVFIFFFTNINISITQAKADSYSSFILGELEKSMKKSFPELDEDGFAKD